MAGLAAGPGPEDHNVITAIFGVIGFVLGAAVVWASWVYFKHRFGQYSGTTPAIPAGWCQVAKGDSVIAFDKVWGFDGWYQAPLVQYVVDEGDIFIRLMPNEPRDEFFATVGKAPGRRGP